MSTKPLISRLHTPIAAAILLTACLPLAAQTVYKSSDGKTTEYSDKPPKSGKAEQITVDPNQNVVPSEKSPAAEALEQQHRAEDQSRYQQDQNAAASRRDRIAQAEANLRAAEENAQRAQEVQPGDYIGRAGGGTRPSPARLERINGAEDAVQQAQDELEAAKYSREP